MINVNNMDKLEIILRNLRDKAPVDCMVSAALPLHMLLQCCADFSNTGGINFFVREYNKGVRKEIYEDFLKWREAAESENVKDAMTRFIEMRKKFDQIILWKK